jgi:SAM-dependent methyltransferase
MTKQYIAANLKAYELTAHEFEQKITLRSQSDEIFITQLHIYLKKGSLNILELGPGPGYIAKRLIDYGHKVTAIEFSPKMAKIAQKTALKARVVIDDFLNHDFKNEKFDAVIGIAFIHLFPKEDAKKILAKIAKLLNKDGTLILSTTVHSRLSEGYEIKSNFNTGVKRFRRRYTKSAFKELITSSGFYITDTFVNGDSEGNVGKTWFTCVAQKAV